ncbi:MAG: acyltransferase [Chthoniobacteraceae bacterium]
MPARPAGELAGLTGLRGIAAMTVFIAHGRFYELVPSLKLPLIFFEWHSLAVDLFFMLSGFVLLHVYAAKFASGRRGLWKPYYAARFARIVPLYLATLLSSLAIFAAGSVVVGRWPSNLTWPVVTTNLFLLQGWPGFFHMSINIPSWSLSVEVFCYIVAMPLALFLHRRMSRGWSLPIIILLLVSWRIHLPIADSGWIGLLRGVTGFFVGALLQQFYQVTSNETVIATTTTAAVLFMVLQSLAAWGGFTSFLPVFTFPFLIQGLASSARSIVHDFFRSRFMLWLGDLSYSVYLWQGPFFLATHIVIRPHLVPMPAYVRVAWIVFEFTFALGLSHLSYHRLELPMRRWLRS